jgi:hypothetical protein
VVDEIFELSPKAPGEKTPETNPKIIQVSVPKKAKTTAKPPGINGKGKPISPKPKPTLPTPPVGEKKNGKV